MNCLDFNSRPSTIMHLDLNSCFAAIEQQANPHLRGKPIAVAAYPTPGGCILAASIEAKRLGIKTGMRVKEGKMLDPDLVILSPDPDKYRSVHRGLHRLLTDYAEEVYPKSIDEFVFKPVSDDLSQVANEIKKRIKEEIGEWLTVSIGIAPNRYLAKVAAGLQKPDGLVEINRNNYLDLYSKLRLIDLTGIKKRNELRLRHVGINSVLDFYHSPIWKLKIAFGGITGLYWHSRLHGYECDDFESIRKTYGNSFALPYYLADKPLPVLCKLCEKTGFRLRRAGLKAQGIHLAILFRNGCFWHQGVKTKKWIFESRDIYKEALRLFNINPIKNQIREIMVSVFNLSKKDSLQLEIFADVIKKESLTTSLDSINKRWGDFVIYPARMIGMDEIVRDRIAFGQ